MTKEKVNRINELYHKSKKEGLTEEEKVEQQLLRQEYVAAFRENLKAQLDNIEFVDEPAKAGSEKKNGKN
ncbi:MAG: DUF896 domain-containing protein [Eubacteriales bacterium]|nr:DUF896 domain-containing protein [Eubacteriales bacterium]